MSGFALSFPAVLCNRLWLHHTEANTEGNKGSSLPNERELESLQINALESGSGWWEGSNRRLQVLLQELPLFPCGRELNVTREVWAALCGFVVLVLWKELRLVLFKVLWNQNWAHDTSDFQRPIDRDRNWILNVICSHQTTQGREAKATPSRSLALLLWPMAVCIPEIYDIEAFHPILHSIHQDSEPRLWITSTAKISSEQINS